MCAIAINVNFGLLYDKLPIYKLFKRELDLPSDNASVK